jgi:hypothetical protein
LKVVTLQGESPRARQPPVTRLWWSSVAWTKNLGTRPFDMTGYPTRGRLVVDPLGHDKTKELRRRVGRGAAFAPAPSRRRNASRPSPRIARAGLGGRARPPGQARPAAWPRMCAITAFKAASRAPVLRWAWASKRPPWTAASRARASSSASVPDRRVPVADHRGQAVADRTGPFAEAGREGVTGPGWPSDNSLDRLPSGHPPAPCCRRAASTTTSRHESRASRLSRVASRGRLVRQDRLGAGGR